MFNVKSGDHAIAKGAVYGGLVVAIDESEETITIQLGRSDLANLQTLHYSLVEKLILVTYVVTAVPVTNVPNTSP